MAQLYLQGVSMAQQEHLSLSRDLHFLISTPNAPLVGDDGTIPASSSPTSPTSLYHTTVDWLENYEF